MSSGARQKGKRSDSNISRHRLAMKRPAAAETASTSDQPYRPHGVQDTRRPSDGPDQKGRDESAGG